MKPKTSQLPWRAWPTVREPRSSERDRRNGSSRRSCAAPSSGPREEPSAQGKLKQRRSVEASRCHAIATRAGQDYVPDPLVDFHASWVPSFEKCSSESSGRLLDAVTRLVLAKIVSVLRLCSASMRLGSFFLPSTCRCRMSYPGKVARQVSQLSDYYGSSERVRESGRLHSHRVQIMRGFIHLKTTSSAEGDAQSGFGCKLCGAGIPKEKRCTNQYHRSLPTL